MLTTTDGVEHECPWVGGCRCADDGSLCRCSHQHGDHGDAPIEYESACTQCDCAFFDPTHPRERPKRDERIVDVIEELALW